MGNSKGIAVLKPIRAEMARIASYLWEKGWAERNAGNFSIRITEDIPLIQIITDKAIKATPLEMPFPDLAGELILISNSGSRMREFSKKPAKFSCLIKIESKGEAYRIIREEGRPQGIPTSELLSHLAIHDMLMKNKPLDRVVIHSHVTELIALSHMSEVHSSESLSRLLWSMHPEILMFLPLGMGFLPFQLPGTIELAKASAEKLEKYPALVWEKHGCISTAPSISEAFDIMDMAAKAAKIYFMASSSGQRPDGLGLLHIDQIKEHYFKKK
jgi:rhamnulose-1-phosphate aldolase